MQIPVRPLTNIGSLIDADACIQKSPVQVPYHFIRPYSTISLPFLQIDSEVPTWTEREVPPENFGSDIVKKVYKDCKVIEFYCTSLSIGEGAVNNTTDGDGTVYNPWTNFYYAMRCIECMYEHKYTHLYTCLTAADIYIKLNVTGVIDYTSDIADVTAYDISDRLMVDFNGCEVRSPTLEYRLRDAKRIMNLDVYNLPEFSISDEDVTLQNCSIRSNTSIACRYAIDSTLHAADGTEAAYMYAADGCSISADSISYSKYVSDERMSRLSNCNVLTCRAGAMYAHAYNVTFSTDISSGYRNTRLEGALYGCVIRYPLNVAHGISAGRMYNTEIVHAGYFSASSLNNCTVTATDVEIHEYIYNSDITAIHGECDVSNGVCYNTKFNVDYSNYADTYHKTLVVKAVHVYSATLIDCDIKLLGYPELSEDMQFIHICPFDGGDEYAPSLQNCTYFEGVCKASQDSGYKCEYYECYIP